MKRTSQAALTTLVVFMGVSAGMARADDPWPGLSTWAVATRRPAPFSQATCLAKAERALREQGFDGGSQDAYHRTGTQAGYDAEIVCFIDHGTIFIAVASSSSGNNAVRDHFASDMRDFMLNAPWPQ